MKTSEDKSRESYNRKADNYHKTFDGKFTMKFKELLLEEIIVETNHNILDVACGNATFLEMLSNKYDITYLCWDYLLEKLTIPNVDINYISRAGSKFKRNVVFIRAIVKTINTTDFDCVFTNYFKGCSLLLPFIFRQRLEINIHI